MAIHKKWTAQELFILEHTYDKYDLKELAEYFGVSFMTVRRKAEKEGITDSKRKVRKSKFTNTGISLKNYAEGLLSGRSIELEVAKGLEKVHELSGTFELTPPTPEIKAALKGRSTLCWKCAKACGGQDCEWANFLQPVPGWNAVYWPITQTKDHNKKYTVDSYHVVDCPKFEAEPPPKFTIPKQRKAYRRRPRKSQREDLQMDL